MGPKSKKNVSKLSTIKVNKIIASLDRFIKYRLHFGDLMDLYMANARMFLCPVEVFYVPNLPCIMILCY